MSELITADLVSLDVAVGSTPEQVIRSLAARISRAGRATNPDGLFADAWAREQKTATGVPGGIAIPHCRSEAVLAPTFAMARLPEGVNFGAKDGPADLIFFIAGDGPQHENIKSLIYEMGLQDKVFMLGIRDDIPDILKSIDLFVLPTLQEALGTSFIEAMAMGKPVIGCDVGGVNEVIKDGVNGYLIKPGDPSDLAEAVIKIFSDYDKLIEMGNNGRKIVLEKFTTSRMCSDMFRLYSSLLKGRR